MLLATTARVPVVGVPGAAMSINSDGWLAGSGSLDANGDGQLCLKQKTITSGHLWGWLWNGVDNTKNG